MDGAGNGCCGRGRGVFEGCGRELGAEWSCRYRDPRNTESVGKDEDKGPEEAGRTDGRTEGERRGTEAKSTVRPHRIIVLVSDEYIWMLHTWFGRDGLIITGRGRGMVGAGKGDGKIGSGRKWPKTGHPSWKMGKRHRSRYEALRLRVRGLEDAFPSVGGLGSCGWVTGNRIGFHLATGEGVSAAKKRRRDTDLRLSGRRTVLGAPRTLMLTKWKSAERLAREVAMLD